MKILFKIFVLVFSLNSACFSSSDPKKDESGIEKAILLTMRASVDRAYSDLVSNQHILPYVSSSKPLNDAVLRINAALQLLQAAKFDLDGALLTFFSQQSLGSVCTMASSATTSTTSNLSASSSASSLTVSSKESETKTQKEPNKTLPSSQFLLTEDEMKTVNSLFADSKTISFIEYDRILAPQGPMGELQAIAIASMMKGIAKGTIKYAVFNFSECSPRLQQYLASGLVANLDMRELSITSQASPRDNSNLLVGLRTVLPSLKGLTTLTLANLGINDTAVVGIAQAIADLPNLVEVSLTCNPIGKSGLQTLYEAQKKSPKKFKVIYTSTEQKS